MYLIFYTNSYLSAVGGYDIGTGSVVRAFVLDIAKSDGLIDLSLKPELVSSATDGGPKTLSSKKV